MPPKDDNPFTGGGGGGGSDSGGGGGGGSAPSGPPIESYLALLQSLGIPLTPEARAFAQQAAAGGWTRDEFMFRLRQTAMYRQAFPGIIAPDGTLRMTEAQYLATRRAYEDIAGQLGLRLSDAQLAALFKNEVSVSEWRMRATAVRRLRDNPTLFQQFRQTLEAQGIDRRVTKKKLLDFIVGLGDPKYYRIWREATTRAAAVQAGLRIGGGGETSISRRLALRGARLGLSEEQLRAAFEQIADLFLTALPESQLRGAGITKKGIVKAVIGGKGAAVARERLTRLLETIEAFETEERADAQLVPTATGTALLTGAARQQASE